MRTQQVAANENGEKKMGTNVVTKKTQMVLDIEKKAAALEAKKKAEALAVEAAVTAKKAKEAAEEAARAEAAAPLTAPIGVMAGIEAPKTEVVAVSGPREKKAVFSVAFAKRPENKGSVLVQLPAPIPNDPNKAMLGAYKSVCGKGGVGQGVYMREVYGWKIPEANLDAVRRELVALGFLEVKPQREAENNVEAHADSVLCALAEEGLTFDEADAAIGESMTKKAVGGYKRTDAQWSATVALATKYLAKVEAKVGNFPARSALDAGTESIHEVAPVQEAVQSAGGEAWPSVLTGIATVAGLGVALKLFM